MIAASKQTSAMYVYAYVSKRSKYPMFTTIIQIKIEPGQKVTQWEQMQLCQIIEYEFLYLLH